MGQQEAEDEGFCHSRWKKRMCLRTSDMQNKINQYVDRIWWQCVQHVLSSWNPYQKDPKKSIACLFNLHCNFSIAPLQSAIAMCRPRRWSLGVACSVATANWTCLYLAQTRGPKDWITCSWLVTSAAQDVPHSHLHDNYHQVPQLSFSFPSLKFLVGLTPSCH